jgi:hypothetical protein
MLAGGSDEQTREEVRDRRVIVPVAEQAAQQIWPTQDRAVGRCRTTKDNVIAAACTAVAAVEHELLGSQSRLPRLLVERCRVRDELVPGARRLEVHLDDSRIGGDADVVEPDVGTGGRALEDHGRLQGRRGFLDGGHQIEVVLGALDRRHEHVQASLPRFDAERRPDHVRRRLAASRPRLLDDATSFDDPAS